MSNNTIDLVVRNTRSHPQTSHRKRLPSQSSALPNLTSSISNDQSSHLNDRIQRLQGNLKMLQKKYRTNLKQGFEHKIKAYRLQAVMQRKILKQAIEQTKKYQEMEVLKNRIEQNEQSKFLQKSRVQMLRVQREEQFKFKRDSNIRAKRGISLSLYEKRSEMQRLSKQSHDHVIQQAQNVDKKKNYLAFIRKVSLKRQQDNNKRELLQKIINNTEKLKTLKSALQEMNNLSPNNQTFLTI